MMAMKDDNAKKQHTRRWLKGKRQDLSVAKDQEIFIVTSKAGTHGTISPSTIQRVSRGSSLLFTTIPDKGYMVKHWLLDNKPAQIGGLNFKLTNITQNHIVSVTFTFPLGINKGTYLADDTRSIERKRRLLEQEGHRQFARVHAKEHSEEEPQQSPEGELQNSIQQHPYLDTQRFDGIDTNLNPEPPLNTEARREFDNQQREQDKEKQLRLGNMPKFSSAPKPSPV